MLPQPNTVKASPEPASAGVAGAGDPPAEPFGVVGRLAVVGGAHHDQGPLVRKFAGVVVERAQGHREAAVGAVLRDLGRDPFRRAQVGAEQHQERGVVLVPVVPGGARRRVRPAARPGPAPTGVLPVVRPGRGRSVMVRPSGLSVRALLDVSW